MRRTTFLKLHSFPIPYYSYEKTFKKTEPYRRDGAGERIICRCVSELLIRCRRAVCPASAPTRHAAPFPASLLLEAAFLQTLSRVSPAGRELQGSPGKTARDLPLRCLQALHALSILSYIVIRISYFVGVRCIPQKYSNTASRYSRLYDVRCTMYAL